MIIYWLKYILRIKNYYKRILTVFLNFAPSMKKNNKIRANRIEYAKSILKQMEVDHANGKLTEDDITEIKGRVFNIMLRGYDLPLLGSTTNTCVNERVLPEPYFFERKGFHKLF
jgi:hypothetical protein